MESAFQLHPKYSKHCSKICIPASVVSTAATVFVSAATIRKGGTTTQSVSEAIILLIVFIYVVAIVPGLSKKTPGCSWLLDKEIACFLSFYVCFCGIRRFLLEDAVVIFTILQHQVQVSGMKGQTDEHILAANS